MQWIRCKRRLPNPRTIVLITDGRSVGIGFLGAFRFEAVKREVQMVFYRPVNFDPIFGIVAWKPMPRPFKRKVRRSQR